MTPLAHHASVDHLRRILMGLHQVHLDKAQQRISTGSPGAVEAVTAYNATYALAAVLGVAQRDFGPEVAHRLAMVAETILVDGDSHGLNQDLVDGAPG